MAELRVDRPSRPLVTVFRPADQVRFPTLAFIDRALGDGRPRFADAANAARLEQLARALTEQYWSDSVWTTGLVSEAAFRRVSDALERERAAAPQRQEPSEIGSAA